MGVSEPCAAIGLLLTFSTYGTHLHGAENGSVDRRCRSFGAPRIDADPAQAKRAARLMVEEPLYLTQEDRQIVLTSLVAAAAHCEWQLYCAHVRTNHVHAVVQPDVSAEKALAYLKARATFALKAQYTSRSRFWAKHGSTVFFGIEGV